VRAVPLRHCLAAGLLVLLYGCMSAEVDDGGSTAPTPETPSKRPAETAPAAVPERPAPPVSGLGAADLLGAFPGGPRPAPDDKAIGGPVFNGPYALELGISDRRRARVAMHMALEWLPVGRMQIWRNPENGHWGTVMATRTYLDAKGVWCREYRQTVTLGGVENQETGAMCRGTDGVWRAMTS